MKRVQVDFICDWTELSGRGQLHLASLRVEINKGKHNHDACNRHVGNVVNVYATNDLVDIVITRIGEELTVPQAKGESKQVVVAKQPTTNNGSGPHSRPTQGKKYSFDELPKKDTCWCGRKAKDGRLQGLYAHMRWCPDAAPHMHVTEGSAA